MPNFARTFLADAGLLWRRRLFRHEATPPRSIIISLSQPDKQKPPPHLATLRFRRRAIILFIFTGILFLVHDTPEDTPSL